MKAVRLNKIGDFQFEEIELRDLKEDEILLEVKACGICGSDIPRIYELGAHKFPITIGHEFSGIVKSVANLQDRALVGKKAAVFPLIPCQSCEMCKTGNYAQCKNYDYLGSRSDGGFAEYCIIPSGNHLVIAEGGETSFEALSMVEPATVAQHAIRKSGLECGQSVLIVGAGPIGIMAARWAQMSGASRIVLTDIQDEKIEFARQRGFEIYHAGRISMADLISKKMNGKRFDVVIEGSGTSQGINAAIEAVRTFGTIALLGNPHRDTTIRLDLHSQILRKEIHLVGIWNSYYAGFPMNEWKLTVKKLETEELVVEDLITHRVPLEELPLLTEKIVKENVRVCKAICIPN